MKATISQMALAMAGMLVCLGATQAEELSYSELESRLEKIEAQLAAQNGIKQAAYSGGYSNSGGCCESSCCDPCGCGGYGGGGCGYDCCGGCATTGGWYAQAELMFMRPHVEESSLGAKLAEEYELAPRFTFGFENACGQGARLRYWHYGHHVDRLGQAGGTRFEWDVLDLEVTNRFQFRRTDVTLGGGVRFADIGVVEFGEDLDNDLIGLTVAADMETILCCDRYNYWSWIYGGRMSILGGDWQRNGVDFARDDNVVAHEIYAGVEYGCTYCGYDMFTQLKFEIQNWHSDFFPLFANSIGFVGPAWTIGVGF